MIKRLTRLENGQRVLLVEANTDGYQLADLDSLAVTNGSSFILRIPGIVVRLRRQDEGAWVALDARLTGAQEQLHPFPADDAVRSTWLMTYPEFREDAE